MLKVGDSFFLDILLNGESIPLNKVIFETIQMHSNWNYLCPNGQLTIIDNTLYFDKNPINDGAKLTILVGTSADTTKAKMRKFRVYSSKKENIAGASNKYTIYLIYDCPRFINESTTNVYDNTSAETIKKIAEEVPFQKTDIDPSADSMKWLPFGKKRATFVRSIAEYAYYDSKSCFRVGVTLDGVLKFKNTSLIDTGQTKNIFVRGTDVSAKAIKVLDDREVSNAGVQNQYSGYKMSTTEQGTAGDVTHTKVTAPTSSSSLNINTNIAKGIESSTVKTAPVKSSNTHANYSVASHQNIRIKNTFSFNTYVVLNVQTSFDLFDPIIYIKMEQKEGTTSFNKKVSGSYLVAAKTIYITKEGKYFEKFQLARQSYNSDVITKNLLSSLKT